MVWVLKGQEEIQMEEQMFGEYVLLGHLNNEVMRAPGSHCYSGSSCHSPALAPALVSEMLAPIPAAICPNAFSQLGRGSRLSLSLFSLRITSLK